MKSVVLILSLLFIGIIQTNGQGTIRGKVLDENGEPAIGATVFLKSDPSHGTATDFDGNYSLTISSGLPQVIVFSLISYEKIEETITVANNAVVVKNVNLKSASKELNEVVITSKAVRSKEYFVESMKRNSVTSIDYVSSETLKRTGDVNVTSAISRITGVSTNGAFITVRGIGDRYVKTSINGLRIPTLDPFTNNIKLDMFPASLVDNITITKTASPDLPGDWAGAYMSVQTKDFPEQLLVVLETGVGYNSQSTFKEMISSQRSSTDWLGYDNGFREHDHSTFVNANVNPSQYQQLVALGLGAYYNSIGVNQENWGEGTTTGETYFKLGLVQLGLLAPAQFNDPDAYNAARELYETGPYKNQAFEVLNSGVPATGKSFSNNWNSTRRKAPLNFSQSFTVGNQTQIFNRPLGFMFSYRYGNSVNYDPASVSNRAGVASDGSGNLVNTVTSSMKQEVSREQNGWSALMNLSYKLNTNNSVSFLFMPNFYGTNNVLSSVDDRDSSNFVITQSQFYEQRRQLIYQLKSEHFIPRSKVKIESNISYTLGKSSAPDFKNIQYLRDPFTNAYQIGPEIRDGIHRYYRYLNDNLFDSQISAELPIKNTLNLIRKLKVGGGYQRNDRANDQYDYSVNFGEYNNIKMENNNLEQLFDLSHFDIHTYTDNYNVNHSTIDIYYDQLKSDADHTFGTGIIYSGFGMLDYAVSRKLRISGGVRIEQAKILTDVDKFDSLGYAVNDPRRNYKDGLPAANPGKLDELSVLPSVNVIYKLKDDDSAPVNVRLNFSQTVARPSIRELSDVAVFDYEYRAFVFGNSNLKMVHITNYDARFESYFKSGENISASIFYKDFRNHIELVKSTGYSWQNVDKSSVLGIELEGKKNISRHFDVRANVSLVHSQTEFVRTRMELAGGVKNYIPQDTVKRQMFGQAPFVINGILTYTADSLGLTVSVSYNIQGKRLVVAADVKEVPDIYEQPRNLIDLKVSKTLGKHFSLGLTIKDLLNSPVTRSYDYADGTNLDYDQYHYGTSYSLSVVYKL